MHAMYSIRMFESYLFNPFYSLIFSLRCFGFMITVDSSKSTRRLTAMGRIRFWVSKIGCYIITAFMLLYLHYFAIKTSFTMGTGGIWTNINFLIIAWVTLITVIIIVLRRRHIGSLIAHIQSVDTLVKDQSQSLKKTVIICVAGSWIYLAIMAITFFLDFSDEKVKIIVNSLKSNSIDLYII